MDNRQCKASELMGKACKNIANIIGYERMVLLKKWKKAFSQPLVEDIVFSKLKNNKDGTVDILFTVKNQSLLLILHYEKIFIIENLNRIVGCQLVANVKFT